MSNSKLSSIDTLWNAIPEDVKLKMPFGIYEDVWIKHKNEIENAFDIGVNAYYDLNSPSNCEQYYNETYGGNK